MTGLYTVAAAAQAASASVSATTGALGAIMTSGGASTVGTGTLESMVASAIPSIIASVLPSGATTTAPVESAPIFLPVGFEIAAIFAGALAGGLSAVNRRFDITGVVALAFVTGLGGGIIRDVLLQKYGIFALDSIHPLVAVLAASLVAFFFMSAAQRLRPALMVVDAFSLGLFALIGSDKALVAGLPVTSAILLGIITAVGGGVIRDLMLDSEPQIVRRGSFYAIAAFTGSVLYVTAVTWLNITKPVAVIGAAAVAILLRFGSLWLGWESPEPVDLTPVITQMPRRLFNRAKPAEAPADDEWLDGKDDSE